VKRWTKDDLKNQVAMIHAPVGLTANTKSVANVSKTNAPRSVSCETDHLSCIMQEFHTGSFRNFQVTATAGCKTLNGEVLMELQFAQNLERELPSKLRRQKGPLPGEP
jgi:hypothetical protein